MTLWCSLWWYQECHIRCFARIAVTQGAQGLEPGLAASGHLDFMGIIAEARAQAHALLARQGRVGGHGIGIGRVEPRRGGVEPDRRRSHAGRIRAVSVARDLHLYDPEGPRTAASAIILLFCLFPTFLFGSNLLGETTIR